MAIFQTGGTTTVKSGPIKNNGGTIVMAGNANTGTGGNITNSVSIPSNLNQVPFYGSQLVAAVSPGSSGNTGTMKPLTTAKFGYSNPSFIIDKVATSIANGSNTILQSMGGDTSTRRPVGRFYSYTRQQTSSFNIYPGGSGKRTVGSQDGVEILASGIDGTTGFYADKSIPRLGEKVRMTFLTGNPTPSGIRLSTSTNP